MPKVAGQFVICVFGLAGVLAAPVRSQQAAAQAEPSPYIAARSQVIAVRAGRLFDASSGRMLTNQVVLITGDRISDVGSNVTIPSGAQTIDLSRATVLPGMIDGHVHTNAP